MGLQVRRTDARPDVFLKQPKAFKARYISVVGQNKKCLILRHHLKRIIFTKEQHVNESGVLTNHVSNFCFTLNLLEKSHIVVFVYDGALINKQRVNTGACYLTQKITEHWPVSRHIVISSVQHAALHSWETNPGVYQQINPPGCGHTSPLPPQFYDGITGSNSAVPKGKPVHKRHTEAQPHVQSPDSLSPHPEEKGDLVWRPDKSACWT